MPNRRKQFGPASPNLAAGWIEAWTRMDMERGREILSPDEQKNLGDSCY